MPEKPPGVDIVAVREHSITSRRTRVHVIVCHDLGARAHSLYEMFRFADRVSPEVLEGLTRELADEFAAKVNEPTFPDSPVYWAQFPSR